MPKLSPYFFTKNTVLTAERLLGKVLVRVMDSGEVLKGRIVETEAYLGLKDPSCHSFGGPGGGGRRTARTAVMYQKGGAAYVYFIYGMYYCFNIVTAKKDEPEAVLIRAVEPLEGLSAMQKNRQSFLKARAGPGPPGAGGFGRAGGAARTGGVFTSLANGPGKLCRAFAITSRLNGESLQGDILYIEDDAFVKQRPTARFFKAPLPLGGGLGGGKTNNSFSTSSCSASHSPPSPRPLIAPLPLSPFKAPLPLAPSSPPSLREGGLGGWGNKRVGVSARVGLPVYHDSCYWPLRFYLINSPFLSSPRPPL